MDSTSPPQQPAPPDPPAVCPECGAAFAPVGRQCWLCGWKVGDPIRTVRAAKGAERDNPYASPPAPARQLHWTFRLSTLFLWTLLVAVVMGVVRIGPGLGIPLAIFCVPAALQAIRTTSRQERKTGKPVTTLEKIGFFLKAFVMSIMIASVGAIALISALFVICMAAVGAANVLPNSQTEAAIIAGCIVFILIVVLITVVIMQVRRSSKG
jgi:hypothetical protein